MKVCQPSGHFFLNFGRVVKVAVLSKIPDGLAASLFMFRRVSEKSFLDVTEHREATYFQPAGRLRPSCQNHCRGFGLSLEGKPERFDDKDV
jgi:hypothetical protein